MSILVVILLFIAALLGGAMNAVAGGGSFLLFPALTFAGLPSTIANATNKLALWPGSLGSVVAYRQELDTHDRAQIIKLVAASFIGGVLGAFLLRATPERLFNLVVPWLLLLATLLLTFNESITGWVRARLMPAGNPTSRAGDRLAQLAVLLQFIIAVYGGYFGGGIGIMMLASLAVMGMTNIHTMNALKTLLASIVNGIAVLILIVLGLIHWPYAIVTIIGATLGGYGGAALARKIDPKVVRPVVLLIAYGVTVLFFVRMYGS